MNTEQQLISAMTGIVGIQEYLIGIGQRETVGERILKSDQLAGFRSMKSDMVTVPLSQREIKSAILSTGSANDPLGHSFKPPADPGTRRTLTLRDLLPSFPTVNSAIEIPVKTAATNSAGVQAGGSPYSRDGRTLGESAYTFTTSLVPVETVGHWLPASSQIMEDSGSLDGVINTELLHGLGLAVEDQLLNGSGANGQLHGLLTDATAYTVSSPTLTKEADILADAIEQVQLADFQPNVIILNPANWRNIRTRKATATDFSYTLGAPALMGAPSIWGLPVVVTNSIAAGNFLVADMARAAILFNRQQAAVEIARHDGSNFAKGMLTLRAIERLALVIVNPLAMVKGSL